MPTKHPRIPVICDDDLADALARVDAIRGGARAPRARRVHDLAIRGAAAVVAEEGALADALERLATRSTAESAPFDRDVLDRIDEEAWGREPDAS